MGAIERMRQHVHGAARQGRQQRSFDSAQGRCGAGRTVSGDKHQEVWSRSERPLQGLDQLRRRRGQDFGAQSGPGEDFRGLLRRIRARSARRLVDHDDHVTHGFPRDHRRVELLTPLSHG